MISIPAIRVLLSNSLAITDKKVFGRVGLIKTVEMNSPIHQIQNVSVSNGLLGKLFKYGTIVITTTTGVYNFKYIKNPDSFKNEVMAQITRTEESKMDLHAQKIADATWLPGIFGGLSGMIGVCVVPLINKKLGEKKTYIAFSAATFVFTMACCIFYWSIPEGSSLRYGNAALYMFMVLNFISAFLMSANTYIPLVMTADIVDYMLWKTGKRKEGVNFAILSMAIKLNNAICVIAGLLIVAASGYTQVVYATGTIPIKMQNIIMFAYIGFAGVSALLSAIPMFFYKIDFKTKEEMRKALSK